MGAGSIVLSPRGQCRRRSMACGGFHHSVRAGSHNSITVRCAPTETEAVETVAPSDADSPSWVVGVQGMLAGATFTVVSVALGALVFGAYGYGMFVLSPLMIGALTGYLANRERDIGFGNTGVLALGATALG